MIIVVLLFNEKIHHKSRKSLSRPAMFYGFAPVVYIHNAVYYIDQIDPKILHVNFRFTLFLLGVYFAFVERIYLTKKLHILDSRAR